jgi:hypothetical protein
VVDIATSLVSIVTDVGEGKVERERGEGRVVSVGEGIMVIGDGGGDLYCPARGSTYCKLTSSERSLVVHSGRSG